MHWDPASNGPPRTEFLLAEMTSHTRELLMSGRRGEAAALFGFAVQQWPDDSTAHNNLGFCLILDDPARALSHLTTAARQGYEPLVINIYNRVCCHVGLRQPRAALEVAEEFWQTRPPDWNDPGSGTLWLRSGETWELALEADARQALLDLLLDTARAQGWHDDEERWSARLARS